MAKNILSVIERLFSTVDKTEASYMEALERKEEQLLFIQEELAEKEMMLRDMHKMKLLGQITEGAYDEEKQLVDALKVKVQEAQSEIQLIQEYKTEDIKTVLSELEEVNTAYSAEQKEELKKLQISLLNAKYHYIEALVDAGKAYDEIVTPNNKVADLRVKLGMQQRRYSSPAYEVLGMINRGGNHYDNLQVTGNVIIDALRMGKNPYTRIED